MVELGEHSEVNEENYVPVPEDKLKEDQKKEYEELVENSTKRASQFDLKLTREKTKVNFESGSAGIPNISQMDISASFADTIDDKKVLNASA